MYTDMSMTTTLYVLVCDVVLMALTSSVLPSTEHVAVFFFCLLHVLEVFGLYATLIFLLIIIIIIVVQLSLSEMSQWQLIAD